ncbi:carbohydrate kinase family protein [Cohnella sp. GCM10027633]|uniref:carbohydrate kinase family protein n=1 Tax=unclassified Cohnella TaxID=2636738 RepID=UPI003631A446
MSLQDAGNADIIVAGHICLDIIPTMHAAGPGQGIGELLVPGKLVDIGAARLSTGGAVSNTGIALHRLGLSVALKGKIGADLFGEAIVSLLQEHGPSLADRMIVSPEETSSYSLVISPPGVDRIFLHCTGANDTFSAADVPAASMNGAKLLHFGYPPLMRRMYEQEGAELERVLAEAKRQGLTVSLDMARPDPQSAAGQADWTAILARVLPHVDVFLPSFEEILYMLRPDRYRELTELHGTAELLGYASGPLLSSLSEELLRMGAGVVALKLGEHGLYARTTDVADRLRNMGACAPNGEDRISNWLDRELLAPCFQVEVAGTTGAGDCTIAGFLAGLVQGLPIEDTLIGAVGVGACNVERTDAVSGIPSWETVQSRIASGWAMHRTKLALPGWEENAKLRIWESV